MDRERAIKAVGELLAALGEDVSREGLRETPRRVADMYAQLLSGMGRNAEEELSKTFPVEDGGIVIERDISFSSVCEHHLMPFFGKIAIAYIPSGRVVGLSKLARCVDICAARLQLQERLTRDIAREIILRLAPRGVFVYCEAEHTCMTCRGVKKPGSKTISYISLGDFPEDKKAEVLALVK